MRAFEPTRAGIVVSATFVSSPLVPTLRYWTRRLGIDAEIRPAPYGQVYRELLDPKSATATNRGVNVFLIDPADIVGDAGIGGGRTDQSAASFDVLAEAFETARERSTAPFVVFVNTGVADAGKAPCGCEEALERFLDRVSSLKDTDLLTTGRVTTFYPVSRILDPEAERVGHIPFTEEFFVALGTSIGRMIAAATLPTKKVIVVDGDNTLWSGVCAEDGASGIEVTEASARLQQTLLEQKEGGKLLCLCSKNVAGDVHAVFDDHPSMPLSLEDFVAARVNWKAKSQNIIDLARELDLGLDSFIFLDDSPVECAEVEARCPEVLTLAVPCDETLQPFLDRIWPFDSTEVTTEDRNRTGLYRQNVARARLRARTSSFADFLDALEMRVEVRPVASGEVPRVAQLSARTSQFNLSPRARTAREIHTFIREADNMCLVALAADRLGDYGLVGSVFSTARGDELYVEGFFLSCRVLGKGAEHRIVRAVAGFAAERGCESIAFAHRPTTRNDPAGRFLRSVAMPPRTQSSAASGATFRIDTDAALTLEYDPDREEAPDDRPRETAPQAGLGGRDRNGAYRDAATALATVDAIREAVLGPRRCRCSLSQPYVAPRPGSEEAIADIWADVLHVSEVGRLDDFADLGGGSLELVRVHSLLIERLGVDLDITTLLQCPTVAAVSEACAAETVTELRPERPSRALEQRRAWSRPAHRGKYA